MNGTDLLERLKTALAGRYAIEREAGSGGMAVVFLADDLKHGRKVALKVLRPELAHAIGPDRFLSEIQITARLDHPHILPLLDSGEADGFLYFVMPFVEGETLRDRLDREGKLEIDDGIQVTGEVAAALAYAHERGVVHRDLKPGNILLQHGLARLADFGIAHAVGEAGGDRLTVTGMSVGTPSYMSPEQAAGDPDVDARSDIYSLACVTYEMLTGEPPFTGASSRTVLAKHIGEPAPRLSGECPEAGPSVDAALARALEKEPADRQATAAEFADDLKTGASERAARKRKRIAAATTAILLVGAIGAYVGLKDRVSFTPPPAVRTGPPAIAVMPFNASGAGSETWLEGVVPLMAANLDGVPGLTAISPGTVLAEWRIAQPDGQAPSREMALEIARVTGASYAVTGGAVAAGEGLRFTAEIHDVDTGEELIKTRAEGPADSALALIDDVALQLIEAIAAGDMTDLPAVNFDWIDTRSVEALKAYLRGEEDRHALEFEQALESYQLATEEDTLFALAWSRLSHTVGLTGGSPGEMNALQREANRRFAALGPVWSNAGQNRRETLVAQQTYVREHPDDADSWWRLADIMAAQGANLGVLQVDIRQALERSVALAPDSRYYRWLLAASLLGVREDSAVVANLIDGFRGQGPASQAYLDARLRFDLEMGDSATRAAAIVGFDTLTVDQLQGPVQWAALHPGDPELFDAWLTARVALRAEQGEDRNSSHQAELVHRFRMEGLGRGHLSDAQRYLRDPLFDPEDLALWGFVFGQANLPIEQETESTIKASSWRLMRALAAADEGRWDEFDAILRQYRSYSDSLVAASDPRATFYTYTIDVLEGFGLWRRGDPGAAEPLFVGALEERTSLSVGAIDLARWWLPQVYLDLGQPADAFRYLDMGASEWLPLRRYEQAKILESLGRNDEALAAYAEFLDYWQDADPSVQFMLDDARRRAEALAVEVG